jgi:hypothetical protein
MPWVPVEQVLGLSAPYPNDSFDASGAATDGQAGSPRISGKDGLWEWVWV